MTPAHFDPEPPARTVSLRTLVFMLLLLHGCHGAAATPMVVVSIKPIHAITGAIMRGAGEPALLFDANVSPHHYALRPSHARALSRADLVIWIGPELETALVRPIASLSSPERSLALLDQPAVTVLTQRGKNHPDKHRAHQAKTGQRDPHIWLDPINAMAIAQVITDALDKLDPEQSNLYRDNLARLIQRLGAAHSTISAMMRPVGTRSFAITHDAMQYFEKRYGLNEIIYLSHLPSVLPGAKRLSAVRDQMRARNTQCVLAEPQLGARWIQALKEDRNINSGKLDILGTTMNKDEGMEVLLLSIAQTIVNCLTPATPR